MLKHMATIDAVTTKSKSHKGCLSHISREISLYIAAACKLVVHKLMRDPSIHPSTDVKEKKTKEHEEM
jgi:hypothetical protein